MSYVETDNELRNIKFMVEQQKLLFMCKICGWGFMLFFLLRINLSY